MLADLLFIVDPREKYKKNFYINDRNFSTKYSLRLRKLRKTFYNNTVKNKKLEQKKHPVPKILYSTAEICDINALKDIIDFVEHKISESEKELKLINIELTTNNIKNNFFNINECSQKIKDLKKRLKKIEKKFNNNTDSIKDNLDQDD